MTMKYAKIIKTMELSNGEDGKKPPSSLRHGDPGTKTAARMIAVKITMEITDHTRPRDSSADSSAESSLPSASRSRSEEHTSELQSRFDLVCRLLLEKKKKTWNRTKH